MKDALITEIRRIFAIVALIISLSWLSSCTKDASVAPVDYKDTTINNNKIPPYQGVTQIHIQTYINRLYIDLIGRIPVQAEMDNATRLIQGHPFSDSVRQIVVKDLISRPDYFKRFFQVTSARMLNATDSLTISETLMVFQQLETNYLKLGDKVNAGIAGIEAQKLVDLQNAWADYENGVINISGFMYRILNNYFYDQVNMGTFNFLKAAFEDLLHRSPTASEQTNATNMINGSQAVLFLQSGTTKGDFIKIMTSMSDFYEGQVVQEFFQFLARKPSSAELSEYTLMIMPAQDLKPMLLNILTSKEYAGF